jgi:predicted transcriptional regulator
MSLSHSTKENNMDNFLTEAIKLVQAQASVRVMSEDEIARMIISLSTKLKGLSGNVEFKEQEESSDSATPAVAPKKSIKEKSIICLECGKVMKVMTKKHLALHGLDAVSYREKYGLRKGTPLACKELQRARREKMKDMKLWERRGH